MIAIVLAAGVIGSAHSADDATAAPFKPIESRGYGTRNESEPPRYVRRASETGYESLSDLDWLQVGADYRARFELRHHDYRNGTDSDQPLLLRSRLFVGVDRIIDPLRLGVELQDARIVNSDAPNTTRDIDKLDILQAYAELYGRDWLGSGEPVRLQVGRLAFEYLDRRLISRNPWRNTTNNFEGFRAVFGSHNGIGWLDLLAVKPVLLDADEPDNDDKGRWFYAAIGSYSGWQQVVTLQPFAMLLEEHRNGSTPLDRDVYTYGVRGYGVFASGFDYDATFAVQAGHSAALDTQAHAGVVEVGYTDTRPWKPRYSASIGYASGDRDPNDDENNRFNRLFGFGRPWSANDYHIWENIITPKLRVETRPSRDLQWEAGYSAFFLESDTDSWSVASRRDRTGQSGDFIGHEADTRVRWRSSPYLEIIGGYTHFFPGEFTRNTGPAPDSDFVYLELNFQLFK